MTTTTLAKLETIIPILLNDNIPIMIWGPSGLGKTQVAKQIAKKAKLKLIDWRTNLRDPVDARGLPVPDMKAMSTSWLRPDDLPFVGSKHGKEGVLLFDEINTGSPAMQNVCLQLVLERRVGEHILEPGWKIIATGNRAKDRGSINRMGAPLKNRFAHFEVEPDIESFISYGIENKLDPRLLAFLRFRKDFLHMPPVNDDTNAFASPRQWEVANKYVNQPRDIRPVIIESLVGKNPAVEFEGFLRVYHELPSFSDVVNGSNTAVVPKEPAARFAVSMMLAREVTSKTFGPVVSYAKRLGREMEAVTIMDSTRHHPLLMNTVAYSNWAIENQDILM